MPAGHNDNVQLHPLLGSSLVPDKYCGTDRQAGHVASIGGTHKCAARYPQGKRPLGRRIRRWEDNIKTDLEEIQYEDVDLIHVVQNKVKLPFVNTAMNLRVQ
jgi:hypothetical protein